MSDYVVHFTQGGASDEDDWRFLRICWDQRLEAQSSYGIGRNCSPASADHRVVCFSEIPPECWPRLSVRRQSNYGIGFRKDFLCKEGGCPVWYVRQGSPQKRAIQEMMRNESSNPLSPLWRITMFVESPGNYGGTDYEFDWEREWRHSGDFVFSLMDVAFLLIPEELHSAATSFFAEAESANSGPAYFCPFIDPLWEQSRVLQSLADWQNQNPYP